jgi:YfiH family protein
VEQARTDTEDAWRLDEATGLVTASCHLLEGVPGVGHAFSTRRDRLPDGRQDDFDLGTASTRSGTIADRRRRLCRRAGLGDRLPLSILQVHGDRLLGLSDGADEAGGADPPSADGVVGCRDEAGVGVAAVRTADCVPVLLADRRGSAVAAVHAGWRGVAAGIVVKAVERLETLRVDPVRLLAAIGPAVGPCCYEVDRDVAEAVSAATPGAGESFPGRVGGEKPRLDLREAVSRQLASAGLPADSISRSPWCTACRADLFFSHRREGDRAGRMMAVIGWIQPAP